MKVVIRPTREDANRLTARLIAARLRRKPDLKLGLATGRTMEAVYAELVRQHREEALDFSLCRTFNLDEYAGIPAEHPGSYRTYMNTHLFDPVNIDPRNTFLPDGMAEDLHAECALYEQAILESGGIDLQLLGLGGDGHIGFNEPLSAFESRTRAVMLNPATLAQNSEMFGGDPDRVPKRALTMGVGTILEAAQIVFLVTGKAKAEIFAKAVEGPVTSMISATALQFHADCVAVADEDAASLLEGREHYRWLFANDPEWENFR